MSDERARSRAGERDDPVATSGAAEDHLADVEEGAGCTEIWEHLSRRREDVSGEDR